MHGFGPGFWTRPKEDSRICKKKCQSLSCKFRHLKNLNSKPHPKNLPKLGSKVLLKSENHLNMGTHAHGLGY